jgi:hypothetical protein
MKELCVELKVCEGCGALFYRSQGLRAGGRGAYCTKCAVVMAGLPAATVGYDPLTRAERQRRHRERRRRYRAGKKLGLLECAGGVR